MQTCTFKHSIRKKKNTFEFYAGVNALLEDEKKRDIAQEIESEFSCVWNKRAMEKIEEIKEFGTFLLRVNKKYINSIRKILLFS